MKLFQYIAWPYRYRVLALLFLLVLIMYLDRLCIAVAAPRIAADLHLSPVAWGWVLGAFSLAYAAFEIPSGALGDRIGSRSVLTRIVLWWSAFTVLTGCVGSYPMLLVVRFLFGAGEAGAFPNCAATVSRWVPKSERARAASVIWFATGVAGVITPLIVVPLEKRNGWRLCFYLFGALGAIWSAVWYIWFRDTPLQKKGVPEAERQLIGDAPPPGDRRMAWRKAFRSREFVLLLIMYHFYCWGAYFYLSWLHTYLQMGLGLTEDQMKFGSTLPPLAGLAGLVAGGYLSDRLAARYSLRLARCAVGSVSLIGAGILLAMASVVSDPWAAVTLLSLGLGVMNGMLPVSWSLCVDLGREHSGAVSGAMNTAGQVGSFLSSVCFGYMIEAFGSYHRALMPLAAMLVLSGCIFSIIKPREGQIG